MEIKMEKARKKEVFYDKMSLSESTLTIFIAFGLLLTALAVGLGYFSGNSDGTAIPAVSKRQEESETAVVAENRDQVAPDVQSERFDEIEE